jgi:hypothetical protein
MNKRILYSENGTLIDFSVNLNKYNAIESEFSYTLGEDFFYIGSRLPFNSIYFKLNASNTVPANMNIEVFDGEKWRMVNEIMDETEGFFKSGHVTFVPDRDNGWLNKDTNTSGQIIPGLESVKIYDQYWMRLSFDQTLDENCSILWAGSLFCDDTDVGAEYPDLVKSSVLSAFQSAKTNWEEQRVRASEIIIQDLMINRVIVDVGQMLVREDYRVACVQKLAEIVFNAFGDDYVDNRQRAREEYQRRLSNPVKRIDINANGIEERYESFNTQGWLSR